MVLGTLLQHIIAFDLPLVQVSFSAWCSSSRLGAGCFAAEYHCLDLPFVQVILCSWCSAFRRGAGYFAAELCLL
jgi:hypothetical protein